MIDRTEQGKALTVARIVKAARKLLPGTNEIDIGFRDTEVRTDNIDTSTWNERCWARDENNDWATDLADIRALGQFTREIRKAFVNGTDVSLDLYCYRNDRHDYGVRELLENLALTADQWGVCVSRVTLSGRAQTVVV